MNILNNYARVYKALIKTSFANLVAYPGNFYSGMFSGLIFTGLHLITIILLTFKVRTVYGWTQGEMIILTIVFNLERALLEVFFYGGMARMAEVIYKGELDSVLMKPINTQFFLSTSEFRFHAFARLATSIGLLAYFIHYFHLPVTALSVIIFTLMSITSLVLLYSLWFMVITFLMWNPMLTNLKDLLAYVTGLLRYPPGVFRGLGIAVYLLFVPFLFVIAPPTLALLGKLSPLEIIFCMILSIVGLYSSHLFWNFALRHYTSASS